MNINQRGLSYMPLWTILALIAMINSCVGQLSFHTDANENSYTIKTPGVQQSFTRYFGGQRGNLLQQSVGATADPTAYTTAKYKANQAALIERQQQQQLQQQQQQLQQQQQQEYQYANGSPAPSVYTQQSAASRYRSPYVQSYVQQQQQQQQQQPQQQVLEQSSTALENLQSAYDTYQNHRQLYAQEHQLQQMQDQQRLRQQQQYQQQMLLQQLYQQNRPIANAQVTTQPHTQNQQQSGFYTAQQYAQYLQQQQDQVLKQQHEQLQQQYVQRGGAAAQLTQDTVTEKVLGLQYSPSDQVSHVNFASGNLKYNF